MTLFQSVPKRNPQSLTALVVDTGLSFPKVTGYCQCHPNCSAALVSRLSGAIFLKFCEVASNSLKIIVPFAQYYGIWTCLIPPFELGTVLLAENEHIIGVHHKNHNSCVCKTRFSKEARSAVSAFRHEYSLAACSFVLLSSSETSSRSH